MTSSIKIVKETPQHHISGYISQYILVHPPKTKQSETYGCLVTTGFELLLVAS